jgi:predicted PurR-regulated permease PerM
MDAKQAEAQSVDGVDGAEGAKENFSPPGSAAPVKAAPTADIGAGALPVDAVMASTPPASAPAWWTTLSPSLRAVMTLALLVALGFLLETLAPVLTPFMFGAILAYVGTPVVEWLAAHRVPRALGAVLIIVAMVGALAGLVLVIAPLVASEISQIGAKLPDLLTRAQTVWLPQINAALGLSLALDLSQARALVQENVGALGNMSARIAGSMKMGGLFILGMLINAMLVPVVMFYLLRDWPTLIEGIDRLVPRTARATVRDLAREIDAVLSEFLRGQGLVMLALAIYYCIMLKLVGLQFWLPVGLVTGLLVFVPYIGFGLGCLLGILAALTQFSEAGPILAVLAVFGFGQILEGFLLTPYLVGDRIGLHPLAVLFALMAFGQLFGFVGVLLALPASAALLVALRMLQRRLAAADCGPIIATGGPDA